MPKCSLCDAPITWARTAEGKSMPLSLPPDPRGRIWIEERRRESDGKTVRVALVASAERPKPPNVRSYRSHFAECRLYAVKKDLERRLAT